MHQPVCACEQPLCPAVGGGFYVSALNDRGKSALLLGPFQTHEEALTQVDLGRRLAERVDYRAAWYAYGTARMPEGPFPAGKLNDLAAEEAAQHVEVEARPRRRARRA